MVEQAVQRWSEKGLQDSLQVAIFSPENRQVHAVNLACLAEQRAHKKLGWRSLALSYQGPRGEQYKYKVYVGRLYSQTIVGSCISEDSRAA